MDDERLKQAGGSDYFDELLARIRDIRSSERMFWRKVLDIYSTTVDYDPRTEASQLFFQVVQIKMHWAAHGQTAAEVIARRADSAKPNMGLTTWSGVGSGERLKRTDVGVEKNYLQYDEMETLNLIVPAYLDFAELQARNRKPMTMQGWIAKLDEFLRISDCDLLTHAGTVSHEDAFSKRWWNLKSTARFRPRSLRWLMSNSRRQSRRRSGSVAKRRRRGRVERDDSGLVPPLSYFGLLALSSVCHFDRALHGSARRMDHPGSASLVSLM